MPTSKFSNANEHRTQLSEFRVHQPDNQVGGDSGWYGWWYFGDVTNLGIGRRIIDLVMFEAAKGGINFDM